MRIWGNDSQGEIDVVVIMTHTNDDYFATDSKLNDEGYDASGELCTEKKEKGKKWKK